MDLETKKDLVVNWFQLLQDCICDDIIEIEKGKSNFKSTTWKRKRRRTKHGSQFA